MRISNVPDDSPEAQIYLELEFQRVLVRRELVQPRGLRE